MASKKNPANAAKVVASETEAPVTASTEETKAAVPVKPKLTDMAMVNVQSNVYGELIYVNPRNGDTTKWGEFGDVQPMSLGDLRAMRGTQRAFFENNWIYVKEVLDDGYDACTAEDVYRYLTVSQYYKDVLDPDNFSTLFTMPAAELQRRISMMSEGAKMNLVVASNDAIRDGTLDSIRKIKVLEDALGCELLDLNN